MYLCRNCFRSFDEPHTVFEKVSTDRGAETYTYNICPHCEEDDFEEADHCRCGDIKFKSNILCYGCRRTLAAKFNAFADELTAEEEEQLDEWLDGNSVTDRRKFE